MYDWSVDYGGPYVLAQYGILTGSKHHHFEAAVGLLHVFTGDLAGFPVSGSFMYRFQNPSKPLIVRAGVAFPEALNLGIGLSF